jgi:hypothetical protein
MFGQDREQLRGFFLQVWRKHQAGETLAGVEQIIAQVILQHPEYHTLLESPDALARDFGGSDGQSNPFLHMGMHIALAEQLQSDRPTGIRALHQALSSRLGNPHSAEHQMMECLGQALWKAQHTQSPPDEQTYLECIRRLSGKPVVK